MFRRAVLAYTNYRATNDKRAVTNHSFPSDHCWIGLVTCHGCDVFGARYCSSNFRIGSSDQLQTQTKRYQKTKI